MPLLHETAIAKLDTFQQRHTILAFPYALIKKYGDDDAGHQAALLTYYGFLSLFPLLIVGISVVDLLSQHNPHLRASLLHNVDSYFPLVGDQLRRGLHGSSKTGWALLLGLVVTLYGARGVADAVRGSLDHAWAIPKVRRSGFPKNAIKSFSLLLGVGLGLVVTSTLTGYATSAVGHSWYLHAFPLIVNAGLLYLVFMYVFLVGTSKRFPRKDLRVGAITAALGLLLMQTAGITLLHHELRNLQGLYGQFALVLAILFWIYLQAQVFVYAIETNAVHTYKLWPRSMTAKPITAADKKAYKLYAEKEAYRPKPEEEIDVRFSKPS